MKLITALLLLSVAAFCVFGFLATYEPVDGALTWRIGYGVAIASSLFGVLRLLRSGGKKS